MSALHEGGDGDGEFTYLNELGRGGMGRVVAVESRRTGQRYALKVVLTDSARARVRFLEELLTWADLPEHANICRFCFFRTEGQGLHVFSELVEGGSLLDVAEHPTASVPAQLRLLAGLARGLHVAHSCGVVHCDVKPQNVLVDLHGDAKLTDFGIARGLGAAQASGAAYTPQYCAPEQTLGRAVSAATDIYGWGTTALHLFHGRLDWGSGLAARHALDRHLQQGAAVPGRDRMPDELASIVARALAQDPAERWESADELLVQLLSKFDDLTLPAAGTRLTELAEHDSFPTWVDPRRWFDTQEPRRARTLRGKAFEDFLAFARALDVEVAPRVLAPLDRKIATSDSTPPETEMLPWPSNEPPETKPLSPELVRETMPLDEAHGPHDADVALDPSSSRSLVAEGLVRCEMARVMAFLGDGIGAFRALERAEEDAKAHMENPLAGVVLGRIALVQGELTRTGQATSPYSASQLRSRAARFVEAGGLIRDRALLELDRARALLGEGKPFNAVNVFEAVDTMLKRADAAQVPHRWLILASARLGGASASYQVDQVGDAEAWSASAQEAVVRAAASGDSDPRTVTELTIRADIAHVSAALRTSHAAETEERLRTLEARMESVEAPSAGVLTELAELAERLSAQSLKTAVRQVAAHWVDRLVALEDRLVLTEARIEREMRRIESRVQASSFYLAQGDIKHALSYAMEAQDLADGAARPTSTALRFQVALALSEAWRSNGDRTLARKHLDVALAALNDLIEREGEVDLEALKDELVLARLTSLR